MLKARFYIPVSISSVYLVCVAMVRPSSFGILDAMTAILIYLLVYYGCRPGTLIGLLSYLRLWSDKNSEVRGEVSSVKADLTKFFCQEQEMKVLGFPQVGKIYVKTWGGTCSCIDQGHQAVAVRYRWRGNLMDMYVTVVLKYLCCSLKHMYPEMESFPDILLSVQYVLADKFLRHCGRPQHVSFLWNNVISPKVREDHELSVLVGCLRILDRDGIMPLYMNELSRNW
jgi:hypothetical protein